MNTLPNEVKEKIIYLRKLLKENAPIVYQKYSALKIERDKYDNPKDYKQSATGAT